ncbi:hypothetical protein OKW42_008147 [Paraburkholderia sp. WC7.3d]
MSRIQGLAFTLGEEIEMLRDSIAGFAAASRMRARM